MQILDCTLRDGGYVNNWNFGEKGIRLIIDSLVDAGIDYIECGFLKEDKKVSGKTFFKQIKELEPFILPEKNYTLMINYGEYGLENFASCKYKNIKLRVAFKKNRQKEALEYIKALMALGYDIFINPMHTNIYSADELFNLINEVNNIMPFGLTIVDTLGNMYEKDVLSVFKLIDNNLNPHIKLGFHSHNSLQLSFSNTKTLLKMKLKHKIIIDSCVSGMGRGAGNLCTELIAKYLNDNYSKEYKILPLLNIMDELKTIYEKTPWGYSTPYYIAAIHSCHPNYATALIKLNLSDPQIDEILSKIPDEEKINFNNELIKKYI